MVFLAPLCARVYCGRNNKNAEKTMGNANSKSLMRGALAAAFLLVVAPVAMPPQTAEAQVTSTVAPYAERLQKARTELQAAITLKNDANTAIRNLMITNIARNGMEFPELAETSFKELESLTIDRDANVAAEATWQIGMLGEKYETLALPALEKMFHLTGYHDNPRRDINIVISALSIGKKHSALADRSWDVLNSVYVDPHAEAGEHRNHAVAAAVRGLGELAVKYPRIQTAGALAALQRIASQSNDTDIVRGIIDGAANIGQHTANKEVKAQARRIIAAYKNHPDKNVSWNADFQTNYLNTHRLVTAPQP